MNGDSGPRLVAGIVAAAVLALSLVLVNGIDLDKSIRPLIPDSSPELAKSAEALDLAPFSRILAVQLSADSPESAGTLPLIADAVRGRLDPGLMSAPDAGELMPDMRRVMAFLPALCDDGNLAEVSKAMEPEEIGRRLDRLKDDLSGVNSAVASLFWRVDPLGLKGGVLGRFPRLDGLPRPDPVAGYPVTEGGRKLLILIRPGVDMSDTDGCVALMENLHRALADALPPGVSARVAGGHRHTAANAGVILSDLVLTMTLAMLLILAIYVFMVKSWAAFWLFLTPAAAVLAATAALSLFFDRVSGLAIGFGAAVMGIAEDYAVHVHFALRRSPDRSTAVRNVLRPLLMSVLLCAGGFGVLGWSAIPAIRQVAAFTILSILAGYVWAILVLPHCPGMDAPRESPEASGRSRRPRKKACLFAAAALALCCMVLFAVVPQSGSVRGLGYSDKALLDDQAAVEETWKLNQDMLLYLAGGSDAESALAAVRRGGASLRAAFPGAETASLADLLPAAAAQDGNMRNWNRLLASRGEAFVAAFNAAAAARGFDDAAFQPFLDWFLASPGKIDIPALMRANLAPLVENFISRKNGKTYAVLIAQGAGRGGGALPVKDDPDLFILSAGTLERALTAVMSRDRWLVPVAAGICFLILLWTFRDAHFALLAFIPALAGLAGVLLWLYAGGGTLGLVETAGLPLVACLGADYGILAVHEFSVKLDLGASRAILVSGSTTIAGIGILILARHPVLHALGGTVFVGLAAAMAAAVLLLPRLCGGGNPPHAGARDG